MQRIVTQFFGIALAATFLLFFASTGELCAQSLGIKISPVRVEDNVEPGQVIQKELLITNVSDVQKEFFPYVRDFKAGGEDGIPVLLPSGSEEGYYLSTWISIDSPENGYVFAPNETKAIPFTVNVPQNIGPGGYFGAIHFGTIPPKLMLESEDKGAGISFGQQSGSLILFRVKGEVLENAEIREFTTDKDLYPTPFNVDFAIRIENKGNVHIQPSGSISLTNWFGQEVGSVPVNEDGANVLPMSIRRFTSQWEGKQGFGRYKAALGLSYGVPPALGGSGMQTLYTEKYFWIIPWKIIIPALLGLITVLAVFLLAVRFYKNAAVRKAMAQAGLGRVSPASRYQGPSPLLHLAAIFLIILSVVFLILVTVYFLVFA